MESCFLQPVIHSNQYYINHSISYPIYPVLQWQLKGYPYNFLEFIVRGGLKGKNTKNMMKYIIFGLALCTVSRIFLIFPV